MAGRTKIEWCTDSWNPIVGCSIVSPGCTNCYAMTMAHRIELMSGGSPSGLAGHYVGMTKQVNGRSVWTDKVALAPEHILLQPLKWPKSRRIFVNSMGDLFHESVPDEWIDQVFAVMALCPQHTFQVLTKRAERMRKYLQDDDVYTRVSDEALSRLHLSRHPDGRFVGDGDGGVEGLVNWPLPNVWLGVSAERQQEADERIPHLLQTPAAIRFVSAEPLLGPIDFTYLSAGSILTLDALTGMHADVEGAVEGVIDYPDPKLDWVIVGGESGRNARPMSIHWAREIRDQCAAAGVPFYFKQWGEWAPAGVRRSGDPGRFAFGDYEHARTEMVQVDSYPRQFTKFGARTVLARVGKKAAGRLLDGREHNEFPSSASAPSDLPSTLTRAVKGEGADAVPTTRSQS